MMKVSRGTIWNTLGSTMYGLNSFIMLALVSRIGTVEEAGAFGIAFTTAQLLYIVGLFGVSHYQMTDYQKKYSFSDYGKLRVFSCGVMIAACIISIFVLQFSGQKMLLTLLLTLLMLLNVVGDLYQNLFFQNNRLDLSGSALFYRTFWSLLVFAGALILTKQLLLSIVLQIICNLLVTLYYAHQIAPEFLKLEPEHSQTGCSSKTLSAECFPLFVSLLLMNLVISASKYGIEFLMNDEAQGYYNMIFMPAQVINLCSQFIFKPMLNQYAMLIQTKQRGQFQKLLIKQSALVIAFTFICCVGAAILGAPVLGLLYQKDLSDYVLPLVLVVLGGGIFALCQLLYYIFVIFRWQKYISGIYVAAAFMTVPVTYGLTQWGGMVGAALSFAGTHCMILILYIGLLLKKSEWI